MTGSRLLNFLLSFSTVFSISMTAFNIDYFIPHRGRMQLVDKIIEVDSEKAVTVSMVNERWPLVTENGTSPLVLIELVAQTAGIYIAWTKKKRIDREGNEKGWLVGIKRAAFHTASICFNTRITTRTTPGLSMDNYMKIIGKVETGGVLIGDVELQLFWIEPASDFDNPF